MLSRRKLLGSAALAAGAVGAAVWGLSDSNDDAVVADAASLPGPFMPYEDSSWLYTRVDSAPVDAGLTSAMRAFMVGKGAYPTITGQGTNPWGTVFHLGTSSDPVWKIKGTPKVPQVSVLYSQGFHCDDASLKRVPSGTQDRPFLVIDPVFGYTLFCGDVVPDFSTRTITVGAAACFRHASNGLDHRDRLSDNPNNYNSRGRIPESLCIRADRLNWAIGNNSGLGYVLQMFWPETKAGTVTPWGTGFCHPMVGCESRHVSGWGAEGVRLRVKPSIDLASRGFTPPGLAIARTLQQHGAYIGDNSGSGATLKGEQCTSTYNPYPAGMSKNVLSKLTWNDFEVLPYGWPATAP